MISREVKKQKIGDFSKSLQGIAGIIIAENKGMTVSDLNGLRQRLRDCGGGVQVVKNTLAKRVLTESPFTDLSQRLSGPLMYGVGDDISAVAKVFADIAKDNPKLLIRGGNLMGMGNIDEQEVLALAKLPSKQQLLATLAGTIQMPISVFARTLKEVITRFARVLSTVRDNK